MLVQKVRYYTGKEAAKILGYSPNYLRQLAAAGKIPCIRTAGGHRRYDIRELAQKQNKSDASVSLQAGGSFAEVVDEIQHVRNATVNLVAALDNLLDRLHCQNNGDADADADADADEHENVIR